MTTSKLRSGGRETYAREVRRKAERMAAARLRQGSAFRYLAHVGVLSWTFVLPVVIFAMLGRVLADWLGRYWVAVALLLLGVAVGGYAVFREIRRSMTGGDEA